MDDQTNITREHLETSKQRARVFREWGYFAAVVVFVAFGIYGLHAWSEASKVSGALSAKADGILDKFAAKIDAIDTSKLNDVADSVKSRVDDIRTQQDQLTKAISSVTRNGDRLTGAAVARIDQVGENLTSLKGVTDESRTAIAGITTATTTLMSKYGLTADEAAKAIALASEKTGKSIDELNRQIANPRWGEAADNVVAATKHGDELIVETTATAKDFHKDLHDTMVELPGIAKDVHKTTTNISKFSKVSLVVSIISRLASAFIPGLLN